MPKYRCALVLALLALAGCGGDDESESGSTSGGGSEDGGLVVSGAASLESAFTTYGEAYEGVRFSFAGSDELAAQIEQGATPDVYAAANTTLPDALFDKGLIEKPVEFAGNRLVLAVPAEDAKVQSFEDVAGSDVAVAVGADGVPVGDYTSEILAQLPAEQSKAIMANVRSEEPDVTGIVGKLTQGAVDAGFVYITDVVATDGELKAIELPDSVDTSAAYGVAVVTDAENPEEAQAFVDGLLEAEGQQILEDAGFEPAPSG